MTKKSNLPIIIIGENMKGFTLIEIMAVIILIGVIALISVPIVNNAINKSIEKAYEEQIDIIENGAKKYMAMGDNFLSLPTNSCYVSLQELKDKGIIEKKTTNVKTKKEMNGYVVITKKDKKYTYEYMEETTTTKCKTS